MTSMFAPFKDISNVYYLDNFFLSVKLDTETAGIVFKRTTAAIDKDLFAEKSVCKTCKALHDKK